MNAPLPDTSDVMKLAACPKCGLDAKTLLHPFCQHVDCPVLKAVGRKPIGGMLEPLVNPTKPLPAGAPSIALMRQWAADPSNEQCWGLGAIADELEGLRLAAPAMKAVLDELEDTFDQQTYTEKARMDFDANDDHEFTVTITAKQLRAIGRALIKAEQGS